MKVLVLGGTGLISGGIVTQLLARGAKVTTYSRHARRSDASPGATSYTGGAAAGEISLLRGDRLDEARFVSSFEGSRYDVVIDMICFSPGDARCTVRAFAGHCDQLIFCSTVCTYGPGLPPHVLVDESFPQLPVTPYGSGKAACERIFERAHDDGAFAVTIVRPSHTYGPGAPLVDQLEGDSGTWDRIERGLPILCAGDGLGLWQSTHRDDCGKFFAHAALNPRTYGEAYNATGDAVFTWRDYYRQAAGALGTRARLVFVPASWLLSALPHRFGFLRETTRFHGAYSSAKAKAHVPEFRCEIEFAVGARETLADVRRRGAWRDSAGDVEYQGLVERALGFGFSVEEA